MEYNQFKGRDISKGDKVSVYRNLIHNSLTIKKRGLVHAHAHLVKLKDVEFKVSQSGNERVNREKVKNVHAYLSGTIKNSKNIDLELLDELYKSLELLGYTRVYYNPYIVKTFVVHKNFKPIYNCDEAIVVMDRIYIK